MQIYEAPDRNSRLIDSLLDVWERSVRATHLFLQDAQVEAIKTYVPQALQGVEHLVVAEAARPVAFMGAQAGRLEMLFVAPEQRGRGLGRRLLGLAVRDCGVRELTVNEQNPQAVGFYEHMGFTAYKRTDLDEQGDPYPLLYMRLG